MIPDFPTIARRRHIVTMIVRSCIVAFAAWMLYGLLQGLGNAASTFLYDGSLVNFRMLMVPDFPLCLFAVGLFLVERNIVNWIVPIPPRDAQCPKCGYSLKNLKSPICPECGINLAG